MTPKYDFNNNDDNRIVSPDQATIFDEPVTKMNIPFKEASSVVEDTADVNESEEEQVTRFDKVKILAALAIVSSAAYAAYWVQEPVQLKADVMSTEITDEASLDNTVAVADDTESLVEPVTDTLTEDAEHIDVSLFGFEPATLDIDKGTTVIWTNTSTADQTIIGSSESGQSFASPVLTSGDTFSYKFEQDSEFEYYSTYNPALKATITVGMGGVASEDTAVSPEEDLVAVSDTDASLLTNADDTISATDLHNASTEVEAGDDSLALDSAIAEATGTTLESNTDSPLDTVETDDDTTLKAAADSQGKLSQTGPVESFYLFMVLAIGYVNRKKLLAAIS